MYWQIICKANKYLIQRLIFFMPNTVQIEGNDTDVEGNFFDLRHTVHRILCEICWTQALFYAIFPNSNTSFDT